MADATDETTIKIFAPNIHAQHVGAAVAQISIEQMQAEKVPLSLINILSMETGFICAILHQVAIAHGAERSNEMRVSLIKTLEAIHQANGRTIQ